MYGIMVAFKDLYFKMGILNSPWVGFKWFETIFADKEFWGVFYNTIIINLYRLLFGFPAPIILALLLNEVRKVWFKKTIQTIVYLPHFISWIVIFGIFQTLLGNSGLVNSILSSLGMTQVDFLSNKQYFRGLLVASGIWKEIGFSSIIYLAAISSINSEMYEAAVIDGAGRFKQAIHITLPSMATTITMLLILTIGGMMNSDFDQVYTMLNPMVRDVGEIIDTYIIRVGISGSSFEIGTAVGLIKNIINLGLLLLANKLAKKISGNGIY
jgi:putative aldouronate transport system permease protein